MQSDRYGERYAIAYVDSISWYFSRCQKVTCGTRPSGCALTSKLRSSLFARSMSKCVSTIAWKQESQNHWKG